MATTNLVKAAQRGHSTNAWLNSYHSFSFANYYNPQMMGFGALRVLNDDTIAAGAGFPTHPHSNMEIITIPLQGALKHQDSIGNTSIINPNEIQVMSAGTGIFHSEYNYYTNKQTHFLQIWVTPNQTNTQPTYQQVPTDINQSINTIHTVISPNSSSLTPLTIKQNCWLSLTSLQPDTSITYTPFDTTNGLYIFVTQGSAVVLNNKLELNDALSIINPSNNISLTTNQTTASLLIIETTLT